MIYDTPDQEEFFYEDNDFESIQFASPGSALRRATRDNPRNRPCPNCERPNVLTPEDVRNHYQCDRCADQAERGGY